MITLLNNYSSLVIIFLFQINIVRPPNYIALITFCIMCILLIIMLHENGFTYKFLYNRRLWGVVSVLFCTVMSSGQMWNHIEKPPFCMDSQTGEFRFIHHQRKRQYVFETYIVMVLCILLVLEICL